MNENKTNKKKTNNPNPAPVPVKKDVVNNNDDLNEMRNEGACSPEFSEGCMTIDEEVE